MNNKISENKRKSYKINNFSNLFTKNKPKKIAILGIVWLMIIVGLIFALIDFRHENTAVPSLACSESVELLSRSAEALVSMDVHKQSKVVDQIKGLEGYEQDPNCTFVIASYYKNTSDPVNSRNYYDKFIATYNSEQGLSGELYSLGFGHESLKSSIDFLEKTQNDPAKASPYSDDFKYEQEPNNE